MLENNLLVLGTVITPLAGAMISLAFTRRYNVQRVIAMASVLLALVFSLGVLVANLTAGPQLYRLGGFPVPYGIIFVADMLSALFGVMATTVVAGGMLYTMTCHDRCVSYPTFLPLFLCMGTGLNGAIYTGDIFTMFVFLELMVVASIVLVAISDNKFGLEAAIKYLFISAMGTLFLLIGIAALYTTFGTLNLADIALSLEEEGRPFLAEAAATMLMCAFLVKSAVFPFHFWQPDFHTTAPTPISAMLSSVVVKVGIYGLIRLVTLLFVEESALIRGLLLGLGIIGIFFGSLGALRTYNVKRVLAYSTFGQIGFILVGIGWGTAAAMVGAIVYAFNHSFIKSALLMLAGVVASRMPTKSAALADIVGVGRGMIFVSILYFLGGMALAGLPPMNGFISKVALIRGGIDNGNSWVAVGLVIGAGILTLIYMMRTWQTIFQQERPADLRPKPTGDNPLAPALLIGICVVLGLYATPLLSAVEAAVAQIGDPSIYIGAVCGSLGC